MNGLIMRSMRIDGTERNAPGRTEGEDAPSLAARFADAALLPASRRLRGGPVHDGAERPGRSSTGRPVAGEYCRGPFRRNPVPPPRGPRKRPEGERPGDPVGQGRGIRADLPE